MEDTLEETNNNYDSIKRCVLILVLMEDTLEVNTSTRITFIRKS